LYCISTSLLYSDDVFTDSHEITAITNNKPVNFPIDKIKFLFEKFFMFVSRYNTIGKKIQSQLQLQQFLVNCNNISQYHHFDFIVFLYQIITAMMSKKSFFKIIKQILLTKIINGSVNHLQP